MIELSVLLAGSLLGGPVGVGTLAVETGPVVQVASRLLRQEPPAPPVSRNARRSRRRGR